MCQQHRLLVIERNAGGGMVLGDICQSKYQLSAKVYCHPKQWGEQMSRIPARAAMTDCADELLLSAAVYIAQAKLRLRQACRDLEHHHERQRIEQFALTFQETIVELNKIGRALENERIIR